MRFTPQHLDYDLSPYTGMTRESWLDAAEYLLSGVFAALPDKNAPVIVPRTEFDITYPHKNAAGDQLRNERMAQRFEGLARTMLIAAPLIKARPDVTLSGIELRSYYSEQILRACTEGDPNYVGSYSFLSGNSGGHYTFQQTVETCALVIGLISCREQIWDNYSTDEKRLLADFLSDFAHNFTVPQNWRMFNMLCLAFLHREGYQIDKNVMLEHAQAILGYYAGGGWYRDGQCFDYYSCWAFNVYLPLWNVLYGYENEPCLAAKFEAVSNELMATYPDFFDRDGFVNMWGRSCVYRCAAVSPLAANFFLKNPAVDPGIARRISSGALLQFLARDDFLVNGVPAMGFYGQFPPLIQGYSCAESAYWLGKAFLCLDLPAEHPFWTYKEKSGWEGLENVRETVLDGPALCFTNHGANGETVLRSGKVFKRPDDRHGMNCCSKLCYNTKFPWEACGDERVESMQYVLTRNGESLRANVTLWCGMRDGVLYRRQFFGYDLNTETHWLHAVSLADLPVRYGIMRVDRLRLYDYPVELTLGTYGFPDNGTGIVYRELDGAHAVILKGHDRTGSPKQLAFTIYDGWDSIGLVHSENTSPDSPRSITAFAKTSREKLYGNDRHFLISQTVTKNSLDGFTDDELFPIASIDDAGRTSCASALTLRLKNGECRIIDFDGIEGSMSF